MATGSVKGVYALEFRGSEVCTAKNGATLDTSQSYTRASKRNGVATIEIRITCPTITSSQSKVVIATLTDELKPQVALTYIKVYEMWNPALAGSITIEANGDIYAFDNCSGKNIQIVLTYPAQTM